jgi:hypothetical protein
MWRAYRTTDRIKFWDSFQKYIFSFFNKSLSNPNQTQNHLSLLAHYYLFERKLNLRLMTFDLRWLAKKRTHDVGDKQCWCVSCLDVLIINSKKFNEKLTIMSTSHVNEVVLSFNIFHSHHLEFARSLSTLLIRKYFYSLTYMCVFSSKIVLKRIQNYPKLLCFFKASLNLHEMISSVVLVLFVFFLFKLEMDSNVENESYFFFWHFHVIFCLSYYTSLHFVLICFEQELLSQTEHNKFVLINSYFFYLSV